MQTNSLRRTITHINMLAQIITDIFARIRKHFVIRAIRQLHRRFSLHPHIYHTRQAVVTEIFVFTRAANDIIIIIHWHEVIRTHKIFPSLIAQVLLLRIGHKLIVILEANLLFIPNRLHNLIKVILRLT